MKDQEIFKKNLNLIYKKLDKSSSLLWSHESDLTQCSSKRLRSKANKESIEMNWKNKETQQTGYGEISKGSMTNFFNFLQNISKFIRYKCKMDPSINDMLIGKAEDYDLNYEKSFLDIGSGFGKPVYHAALQVGCISKGVEIVPARVEFCMDFLYENFSDKNLLKVEFDIKNKKQEKTLEKLDLQINFDISKYLLDYELEQHKINLGSNYGYFVTNETFIYYENILSEFNYTNFISTNKSKNSILILENNIEFNNNLPNNENLQKENKFNSDYVETISVLIFEFLNKESKNKTFVLFENLELIYNFHLINLFQFLNTIMKDTSDLTFYSIINNYLETNTLSFRHKYFKFGENIYYDKLIDSLKVKEQIINDEIEVEIEEGVGAAEDEITKLKETMNDLKFKPIEENWHNKISFEFKDATTVKAYEVDSHMHYSHIYSYNKLMSKDCTAKVSKVLNKTDFKVLAWYSNNKKTIKAGLKNFLYLCKFPMQSTSTEKFHCYVFIKTK